MTTVGGAFYNGEIITPMLIRLMENNYAGNVNNDVMLMEAFFPSLILSLLFPAYWGRNKMSPALQTKFQRSFCIVLYKIQSKFY